MSASRRVTLVKLAEGRMGISFGSVIFSGSVPNAVSVAAVTVGYKESLRTAEGTQRHTKMD